jgi:NAD+ synthase (glutamine-hydrolysing)
VLIYLLAQLGSREIGMDSFTEKLSHMRSLPSERKSERSVKDVAHQLLTCVYQFTRNSSAQTFNAAKSAASAVGADFLSWHVDAMVDGYVRTVAAVIGTDLSWSEHDMALQNIQARARGPGIWLLANLRGALLLTTSNRSEAAVGYATMDGDTCGGLAPIAGVDKAFLLDWLKWMEKTGPAGVGPLPELSVVNNLKPTAELRPPSADQTDEADLMPYRLLDAIERAAIRDKLLPVDVFQAVRPQFPQYENQQIGMWVERFFQLWCRNQWKRERYAPSFHLDDENLDPKTWCRFPILNSGFDKELAELREFVRTQKA